jgi:hypothetical protein
MQTCIQPYIPGYIRAVSFTDEGGIVYPNACLYAFTWNHEVFLQLELQIDGTKLKGGL